MWTFETATGGRHFRNLDLSQLQRHKHRNWHLDGARDQNNRRFPLRQQESVPCSRATFPSIIETHKVLALQTTGSRYRLVTESWAMPKKGTMAIYANMMKSDVNNLCVVCFQFYSTLRSNKDSFSDGRHLWNKN